MRVPPCDSLLPRNGSDPPLPPSPHQLLLPPPPHALARPYQFLSKLAPASAPYLHNDLHLRPAPEDW